MKRKRKTAFKTTYISRLTKRLFDLKTRAADFIDEIGINQNDLHKDLILKTPTDRDYSNLYLLLKQVYQQGLRDGRKKPVQRKRRKAKRTRRESVCTDDRCGF